MLIIETAIDSALDPAPINTELAAISILYCHRASGAFNRAAGDIYWCVHRTTGGICWCWRY